MSISNVSRRSLLSVATLLVATFCLGMNNGAANVRVRGAEQLTSTPSIERPRIRGGSVRPDSTRTELAKVPIVQNPRIRVS